MKRILNAIIGDFEPRNLYDLWAYDLTYVLMDKLQQRLDYRLAQRLHHRFDARVREEIIKLGHENYATAVECRDILREALQCQMPADRRESLERSLAIVERIVCRSN